jgi:salicylate hydroxylase
MIDSAPNQIKTWIMHDMKTLHTWTTGHAALLGDAAHPFQPCEYILLFIANH